MIDRRLFLGGTAGAIALLGTPAIAIAKAATDRRLIFIMQRGAADGLATVAPVGDPAFGALRREFADEAATGSKLDAFFSLHPALVETARLYAARQALLVHAVASPYRERSHFDGQNVLETGGDAAYRVKDGWMNRLLGLLPSGPAKAVAVSAALPLALRGPHQVASYSPTALPVASDDLLTRVGDLYHSDPQLMPLWNNAIATRKLVGDLDDKGGRDAAATGTLAARLLGRSGGHRIAFIETSGWDTHAAQQGRLRVRLNALDTMVAALRSGLGSEWTNTLVLVATEFGRTATLNGTGGTDHGTASAAMLLGGAVNGGRVLADWPGLAPGALYEGRDLKPTLNLDAVIASAVAQHYGLGFGRVAAALFPKSSRLRPLDGLIRS